MSERGSIVEWTETVTEVIIVTEEYQHCDDGSTTAVLLEEQPVSPSIQNVLETMAQHGENDIYCGECHNLFKDQCDLHGGVGPSFVLDSPTALGVPQRALLTLPHGLMIGRSSIPGAGLGVMNQGPVVTPGMHFGPYEGEITTREEAMESDYSWEICKRSGEYEYIDASRETHCNWMRYVNCARSEEETNLLVVQCRGSVLFHCCRPISPGEELMVWPSDGFLLQPSLAWNQIWFRKCTSTESGAAEEASEIFLCALCPLSFTTESYLQRHADHCHAETEEQTCHAQTEEPTCHAQTVEQSCAPPAPPQSADHPLSASAGLEDLFHPPSGLAESENLPPDADMVQSENPPPGPDLVLSEPVPSPLAPVEAPGPEKQEEPNKCSQCGKVFMYSHHLKRHNQSVHLRTRPYCCAHCKRCFSQSSGLLRHQLTHQKRTNNRAKAPTADVAAPSAPRPSPAATEPTALPEHHPQPEDPSPMATEPTVPEHHPQPEEPSPMATEPTAPEHHPQPEPPSDPEPSPPPSEGGGQPTPAPLEEADEAPHKCSPCQRVFTNRYHLDRHKQAAHSDGKRPHRCAQCKRCFAQPSDLADHVKVHQRQMKKKRQRPAEALSTEDEEEENLTPVDDDDDQEDDQEDPDPPFVAPSSAVGAAAGVAPRPRSQRMKHLGSRSRLSAITRLIAPKRRQPPAKRRSTGPAPAAEEAAEAGDAGAAAADGTDAEAESGEYSCAGCKSTFETPAEFKDHQCSQVRDGPFTCPKCQTVFKKYGNLLRHDRVTHSGKTYPCPDCGHLFTRPAALKRHREMDSCGKVQFTSEVFACSYCQYSFTSQYYLAKHVKRHHPLEFVSLLGSGEASAGPEEADESHSCSKCGKTYGSFKGFKAHKCMKQGEILYLCTECGKGFSCFYALKQHHLFHTGEKPHRCPHCHKCFMLVGQLNVHIRTHTGEKPYLCTHCGESFRQSGDLKRHEGKHTGVRPHQCTECGKGFSRPQSLRAHQLLHSGQKLFKCTQCGKSFSRSYHLKRHHQKMHTY